MLLAKLVVSSTDGSGSNSGKISENIGAADIEGIFDDSGSSRRDIAAKLDTFGRALVNNLTTRAYYDTVVTIEQSITAILAE